MREIGEREGECGGAEGGGWEKREEEEEKSGCKECRERGKSERKEQDGDRLSGQMLLAYTNTTEKERVGEIRKGKRQQKRERGGGGGGGSGGQGNGEREK